MRDNISAARTRVERHDQLAIGRTAMHARSGHRGNHFLDVLHALGRGMDDQAADMNFLSHFGFLGKGRWTAQRRLGNPLLYRRRTCEYLIHPDGESVTCDDDTGESRRHDHG